jgi:hypothetical protein
MKMAVELQSGPFSIALTIFPIQLSPCAIELSLCWDCGGFGVTIEKLGSVPAAASVSTWVFRTKLLLCCEPRHS